MVKSLLFQKFINQLTHSAVHFFYPPQCLHCGDLIEHNQPLFCPPCTTLLDILNPKERCPTCFEAIKGNKCPKCIHGEQIVTKIGAVFEYVGPAASLIKKLKYGNQPHLAEGAGAFMVAQFVELNWPMPDAIIPVPLSFTHWIERGYNQSYLLAHEMSRLMQVPVWDALKRHSGDYSQAGLRLEQRKNLSGNRFKINKEYPFEDKKLLIVDDVMTSGTTIRRCAEVLSERCPSKLYALTFCRT
ncbi:MAG: ComF family protein [Parachlamydiaceae bacterium]|nr:ComF family protein [Parachlamydiaceae bacterium]